MGYAVPKSIYMVITCNKNGKRKSGVWEFGIGNQNVYAELQKIDWIESAIVFTSKKLAMDVAKDYNDFFISDGTYLYKDERGA